MKDNALALFDYAGLALGSKATSVIFTTETTWGVQFKGDSKIQTTSDPVELNDWISKGGTIVTKKQVTKQGKQSESRNALGLKGKDNADQWEATKRDAEVFAFRMFKQEINSMDETQIGLKRLSQKIGTDGLLDTTVRFKQVPLKQATITIEQVMKAFGISRDQAIAKFAADGVLPKGGFTTNVSSEVVPPAQLPEKSEGMKDLIAEANHTDKQAAKGNKGSTK